MKTLQDYIDKLNALNFKDMYNGDFFLTWEKTDDELEAVFTVADALRFMRENNISTKVFESGLGISLSADNSTRTRFSFASACNLLGLEVQDLDEGKSQVAHGETVRETANMISFMADVIGIRDDMYIGKGNAYMHEVVDAVTQGNKDGILEQKPTLVNLQCDIDHPTQAMADMLHIIHEFGGVENLKGKKIAMTWAYSPSYGKPLSVPQGIIGLMTRFGMDVVLAHPEGYEVFPEVEAVAAENAKKSGGTFTKTNSMAEAFKDADIVYPKSWAPFAAMEKRTELYGNGDFDGIKALEQELLAQNAQHKDWACTEELMKTTKDGKALYMHCLPADITGVSCEEGEVDASVFDRYRDPLYKEASYKPYIIAAMIFLAKFADPADILKSWKRDQHRGSLNKKPSQSSEQARLPPCSDTRQNLRRTIIMLKYVETKNAPAAIGPYSQGIILNGIAFFSGQIPLSPETGEVVGTTIEEQTEQVMQNVKALLESQGAEFTDVVKTTCFLADMADFAAFNEIYAKYFTGKPARSCVAVKALPKGVLCEVETIAAVKEA